MREKILDWTSHLPQYLLLALYYWLGILRGFIFFGLVPSTVSLLFTYKHILKRKDVEKSIQTVFFENYQEYKQYKMLSFFMTATFIALGALFMNSLNQGMSLVLIIVIIYFLLMVLGVISYAFDELLEHKQASLLVIQRAFNRMMAEIKTTVLLLSVMSVFFGIFYYNIVLFLVVFPAVYAAVATYLFGKLKG